jgi:hypothetical protein
MQGFHPRAPGPHGLRSRHWGECSFDPEPERFIAVDATPQVQTVFIPTSPMPAVQAALESPILEVWPKRGHRDDLEALGLLLGVLSILLALAVGLGVTPAF